ncbi:ATP-binding cassette domain-containing protein [Pendulispora albinea]|uniref:ATP-binding cassette domain-containing protein n=1 Tax=Pendulispora albinea TaxID=2741071 RepID=A0ABZ2M3X2_9BACT
MAKREALEAKGLRVLRGGKVILRDVDVTAHEGEVLGVLGPSGAGKSTLFRALVGERLPDAGTVRLGERDVTQWPLWKRAREGVGYIPQSPSVLWDLTVRENLVAFHRIVHGTDGKPEERAEAVGLDQRLDVRAGELSGGERRRLEFARATTGDPRVLVCDEPFSGIDPVGAARLGELLRARAAHGTAVLLADHHVEEALSVCTRAILLLDGAVAVSAAPDAFKEHPLVRGRYLGTFHPRVA